jgi:hypothetical protein
MDIQEEFRNQQSPELPSEAMQREFQLWNEEYTLDALTDLTPSQIESKRLRFEDRVESLVREHNPGRLIKQDPYLLRSMGKPAYAPDQWEQAKKTIQREAEKTRNRFDRAKGVVKKEQNKSKKEWYTKIINSIVPDTLSFKLK